MQRHLWEPQPYARKPAGNMPNLTQNPTPPHSPAGTLSGVAATSVESPISGSASPSHPPYPPPEIKIPISNWEIKGVETILRLRIAELTKTDLEQSPAGDVLKAAPEE